MTLTCVADPVLLRPADDPLLLRPSVCYGASLSQRQARHRKVVRRGPFLVRVGKHADMVEFHVADELAQLLELRLGFAGESDDERRSERDAGKPLANPADQRFVGALVPGRFIRRNTSSAACCRRKVDVFADLLALGHRVRECHR